MIKTLLCICIHHFCKDILASIIKEIRPEYQQDAIKGRIPLCKANLDHILLLAAGQETPQYWLATGNKLKFKNLDCFADYLWNFDDKQPRKHWAEKSYQMLYRRAFDAVTATLGPDVAFDFGQNLKHYFYLTNWILPYPNHTVFWQHNKQGEQMWLTVWNLYVDGETMPDQVLN